MLLGVPVLVAMLLWGDNAPPQRTLPADFECRGPLAVVADRLLAEAPQTLADLADGLAGERQPVVAIVSDPAARERVGEFFGRRGLRSTTLLLPVDTLWLRDFGPLLASDGPRWTALDFCYNRRSGPAPRDRDDKAAAVLAERLHVPVEPVPLAIEPGNILSNGAGIVLTTTRSLDANIQPDRPKEAALAQLGRCLGAAEIVVLEPLQGDTTGHVDLFACWTDRHTVVLGRYDPADDPFNAPILERNAERLAKVRAADGRPLRVVRVPMGDNADGRFRTYTNVLFVAGRLFVPSYRGEKAKTNEEVEAVFGQALPGWKIRRVACDRLIELGGALRCMGLVLPNAGLVPAGGLE